MVRNNVYCRWLHPYNKCIYKIILSLSSIFGKISGKLDSTSMSVWFNCGQSLPGHLYHEEDLSILDIREIKKASKFIEALYHRKFYFKSRNLHR